MHAVLMATDGSEPPLPGIEAFGIMRDFRRSRRRRATPRPPGSRPPLLLVLELPPAPAAQVRGRWGSRRRGSGWCW